LRREAKYGDEDFWTAFKVRGLATMDSGRYGFYRVIDSAVGDKYFKEKEEGIGKIELQNAVRLNYLEAFYPLKDK
jgi:hypothetical protein